MSIVAFYGSNKGITEKQNNCIIERIKSLKTSITEFRHCDTLIDVNIHEQILLNNLAESIIIYPPTNIEIRGFSAATNKVIIKEEAPLSQNIKRMCNGIDLLIVAPHITDNITSGPYITIEIAKKMNVKEILIIYPHGSKTKWPSINTTKIKNKIAKNKNGE